MKYRKLAAAVMAAGLLLSGGVFLGGCGSSQQAAGQKQAIKVSTFKPFKSDTPIMREYTGSIMALQEVPVRSKVSGTVMEKYISGGEQVGPAPVSAGYKKLQFPAGYCPGPGCPGCCQL